ncbi:hypothetical protein BH20ACI4_BH20ACI4_17070 [soil metagenome]
MLENLVESKNNSRAARKLYGFLFSTFLVIATILLSATVWSLFAKDFAMGNADFELSTLIMPIPVAENKPQPEPEKPKQQNEPQNAKPQIAVRQTNMARIDEVQRMPDTVSVVPNTNKARPDAPFEVRPNAVETNGSFTGDNGRGNTKGSEIGFKNPDNQSTVAENKTPDIPKPPVIKKTEENKKPTSVTLGVINGKASSLPKPPYPAPARAVGADGAVNVQVTINEQGSVISAKAVSGHPLLRQAAEDAARKAKFTPTYLSKIAVKVNGLIVYNFTK